MPRPVIAAIPNHNMGVHLERLIPDLLDQNYANVVVLDDASEDDSWRATTDHGAVWSPSPTGEQIGAGPTRNRVTEVLKEHHSARDLGGAIIHFVDADMQLLSGRQDGAMRNPDIAREIFDDPDVAMAGGLIRERSGHQMPFNFGPHITAAAHVGGALQLNNAERAKGWPERAASVRRVAGQLLAGWPDTTKPLEPRTVGWVAEGNLLVPAHIFKAIGGFPPVRYHEVQGPAIEINRLGMQVRYEPRIEMTHLQGGEHSNRIQDQAAATWWLARRYGLGRFVTGRDTARV
jgi:N-acetylglucosaminyl-diphospho-decaprenol L-rhamnosyltransferase